MRLFYLFSLACSCNPAGTSGHANECHSQTGNCQCLSHVTGRDCSYCEVGFFNLQPSLGCERYTAHPQCNREVEQKMITEPTNWMCYRDIVFLSPPSGASAIQSAHRPPRATQSQGSVCVAQGWRGVCVMCVVWASLDSHHKVAEVQEFTLNITSAQCALL